MSVVRDVFNATVEAFNNIQLSTGETLQSGTRVSSAVPSLVWRTGGFDASDWQPPFIWQAKWSIPATLTVQGEAGEPGVILDAVDDLLAWCANVYGLPVDSKGAVVPQGLHQEELRQRGELLTIADRFVGPYIQKVAVRTNEANNSFSIADLIFYVEFLVDNTPKPLGYAKVFTVGANILDYARNNPPLDPGSSYKLPVPNANDTFSQGGFAKPEDVLIVGGSEVKASFPPVVADKPRVEGTSSTPMMLSVETLIYTTEGGTVSIGARVIYMDGSVGPAGTAGSYVVSDTSVCTVAADGTVTGVHNGTTTIAVSYLGQSATVWVNVGVIRVKRTISQPADGSDFTVTLSTTMPNDSYSVVGTIENSAVQTTMRCPNSLAADRTTTAFRCITATALNDGDIIDFVIVP